MTFATPTSPPGPFTRRIVIVGGTSAIALECAKLWLHEQPSELLLIGRNLERLHRVGNDLAIRFPRSRIDCLATKMCDPDEVENATKHACTAALPNIVLIAHGSLPSQATCERDLTACRDALDVNGVSPALWAEAFAKAMKDGEPARLIVIGSVAGERGRQSNYVYGAAKGLLARYVQGLQHRMALSRSSLKVVLVKPGPTTTPMTAHLAAQGQRMASVEEVGRCIVGGVAKGMSVVYAPRRWRIIMMVIRHLPTMVFNRLNI